MIMGKTDLTLSDFHDFKTLMTLIENDKICDLDPTNPNLPPSTKWNFVTRLQKSFLCHYLSENIKRKKYGLLRIFNSKLVQRRKRPKVDTLFSSLFFPTRPSDEYDLAPSRKYSRPLLDVLACIG